MKDLRSHHFNLGTDPHDYTSEAAANYKEPKRDSNLIDVMNPYKNSYKIGDGSKGQPDHYTSVYKELMVEKPINQAEVNRKSSMDQVTSIKLGFPNKGFEGKSEFADQ